MKTVSLFILSLSALAISSCCCQSQNAPRLRPMPKDTAEPILVIEEPIMVAPMKNAK